jgi:hypothetical protein
LIKLGRFSEWSSALSKSEVVKGASDEADVYRFTFQDGTVQDVKQEEHSSLDHYITYSVISSQPGLTYSSVLSTIRCYPITSGELEGSTFVSSAEYAGPSIAECEHSVHRSPSAASSPVMLMPVRIPMCIPSFWLENWILLASAGVIQDGRFKRRDALKDLAAYVAKKA